MTGMQWEILTIVVTSYPSNHGSLFSLYLSKLSISNSSRLFILPEIRVFRNERANLHS